VLAASEEELEVEAAAASAAGGKVLWGSPGTTGNLQCIMKQQAICQINALYKEDGRMCTVYVKTVECMCLPQPL
jgi:hypothetical protein